MPITFPAHAAAILPLVGRTRRLPGTALLAGSAAPDFAFAAGAQAGSWSHTPAALLLFCLPLGLAVYAALDGAILPALREASGSLARALPGRGLVQRTQGWAMACAAVLVGALTHLAWDSLTHSDRWPAAVLFTPSGAAIAHQVSSWAGSVIVLVWALVRIRRQPSQRHFRPRALALLAGGAVTGGALALGLRLAASGAQAQLPFGWTLFVGGFVGLLLASVGRMLPRR